MTSIIERFSTTGEIQEVYDAVTHWCAQAGIDVTRSGSTPEGFEVIGEKTYKSSIIFRWRIASALFFLGFLIALIMRSRDIGAYVDFVIIFSPLALYVIYYFYQARPKIAEFRVEGTSGDEGVDVALRLSKDIEDAAEELTELLNRFVK